VPNTTNKIRTNLSILTTCLPVHLNHVNHHVDNNLPLRRSTIIEDTSQQDPSQWQDWDDWGKWKTPTSNDQSTWQSRKADHAHSTTHQHSTWDNTRFHSHHPAARLSAGSRTPNLLPPSPVPLNHITGPKNGIPGQTWSDTGDHSRGSSSLPAGHMQISLHDGKPSG